MKLRKAIKLAAAGAVVGAAPMLAMANSAGLGGSVTFTTTQGTTGTATINCPGTMTCDSANAITDAGFVMFKATDGSGNNFYVTGIVDNNEGVFNTLTVVGEEANTSHNNGAYNQTNVQELGLSDDDFKMTATITTGDYSDTVAVHGQGAGTGITTQGSQKVAIGQSIYDNLDSNAFFTGFDYTNGTTTAGHTYETFDINLNVNSGSAATGDLLNNSFQLLETKVDGATAGSADGVVIGKTLMIDQLIDDQADTADTFTQAFIQNEAADGAVAGSGTVIAGAGGAAGSASFTFSAGDTLAVKTLEQNLNGAAADFGLSDAADESGTTNQEAGVDNQLGIAAMSATMDNTNLADPFVSF
jgi:hypothetical protein